MLNFLKLIRFPNLLIIIAGQALIHYCIIHPAFQTEFMATGIYPDHLPEIEFYLLVISTVLIAAGGYVINDYFDIHIDEINKPGKNIVGKWITENKAKQLYFLFSGAGVILGFYLSVKISKVMIGLIPLFCAVSLWMYSSYYKRRVLSGNIMIAVLSSMSFIIVGLYEPEFYRNFIYLLWYAGVAFLVSFIREIIKDIEDADGDERAQCKTLPVRYGTRISKIFIYILILLTIIFIFYILNQNFRTNSVINFWYLIAMFLVPFIALSYLVLTAKEKQDYHYASVFSKIIMAGGILTIIPFWYYFLK